MSPWDCGALSPASASVRSASQPGRATLSNGSGNCLTASPPAEETPACCDQTRQARAPTTGPETGAKFAELL